MEKNCSLCGNIYHNTTFRGGYICEDCLNYIKTMDILKVTIAINPRNRSK